MLTREQVAKVLYAEWCYEEGYGEAPTEAGWVAYEADQTLNSVGLTKQNFLETADAILASVNLSE